MVLAAGAAGHLGGRAHALVDRSGAGLVDQRHAALGHAVAGEKALVGLHQHVENRIADPENVVFRVSHSIRPVYGDCAKGCGLPDRPRASKRSGCYRTPMIRSFLTVSSGTLASRLLGFVRDSLCGAARRRRRRRCVPGGVSAGQCRAAAADRGRAERRAGAGLAAGARDRGRGRGRGVRRQRARHHQRRAGGGGGPDGAGDAAGDHRRWRRALPARETLQLAVDNARLMLPYLAFAGPVTVMMALLNAQGRFALTAFSPLLFNIALIAVMARAAVVPQDAVLRRAGHRRHRRHRRAAAIAVLVLRSGGGIATPLRISFDHGDARLSRQGGPRHDAPARRNC